MKKKYYILVGLGFSVVSLSYSWNTQINVGITKPLTVNFFNASEQHGYSSSSTPLMLSLQEYFIFQNSSALQNLWVGGGVEYTSIQNYYTDNSYSQMFSTIPIYIAARLNANVSGASINPYVEGRIGINAPLGSKMPQPVGIGGYAGVGVGLSQGLKYSSGFNAELLLELSQILMENHSIFTPRIGFTLGYNFSVV